MSMDFPATSAPPEADGLDSKKTPATQWLDSIILEPVPWTITTLDVMSPSCQK